MKRVVFISSAFYGLLLIFYLSAYAWDPSVFIVAGERFTSPRADIYIHPHGGYDGQFYYRLALDPLTGEQTAYDIHFDNPAYRQQRILYPALAWLLGRVLPLPWAMLLVNYAALVAIGWLGVSHTTRTGRSPEWGLLFVLWPGFLVSLTRALTEPLADLVTAKDKAIKRVAILARNDLFPLAIAQEMEKSAKSRGLDVVTFERYAIGALDHGAAITQMRAARPDWFEDAPPTKGSTEG